MYKVNLASFGKIKTTIFDTYVQKQIKCMCNFSSRFRFDLGNQKAYSKSIEFLNSWNENDFSDVVAVIRDNLKCKICEKQYLNLLVIFDSPAPYCSLLFAVAQLRRFENFHKFNLKFNVTTQFSEVCFLSDHVTNIADRIKLRYPILHK